MRLKSFYGDTIANTMKAVRDELGSEAIIIANREDETGKVKVTAAVENESFAAKNKSAKLIKPDQNDPQIEHIIDQFIYHGIPRDIIEVLYDKIAHFKENQMGLSICNAFETSLSFKPISPKNLRNQGPIVFIGPPGAGKSISLIKLATQLRQKNAQSVIITLDTQKAGALEQLSSYAKLLNIDLICLEDVDSLEAAIEIYKHLDYIFIDTPGLNIFSKTDYDIAKNILIGPVSHQFLVLPAGIDAYESRDIALSYHELGIRQVIVTKTDLTKRFGSIFAASFKTNLNLTNFAFSPSPSSELQAFNSMALCKLFFPTLKIGEHG